MNKEKEKWEKAKDSQKLLSEFIEARNTLAVFQQGGFDGVTEQRKKVLSLYDQVEKDKMIKNWSKAQDTYQKFIWELADFLTDELNITFGPQPQGGGCGGGC